MSILLALVAVVVALCAGYAIGRARGGGAAAPAADSRAHAPPPVGLPDLAQPPSAAETVRAPGTAAAATAASAAVPAASASTADARTTAERARLVRSFEHEAATLRRALASRDAAIGQLLELAAERHRLFAELAGARADTARYRQLVVDLENNAPPPLFGTGAPDDLKLIVGVGPVLERMLHQLGVMTYRQIAGWTERDIDEFDAKLREFPGRIRRDAWVTQARALHQSKYGETLPARGR